MIRPVHRILNPVCKKRHLRKLSNEYLNITILDTVTANQMMSINHTEKGGSFRPGAEYVILTNSGIDIMIMFLCSGLFE